MRDFIEGYLRKAGITYCVDMDNTDFENIKSLHQKRDRQIIFLVAIIFWMLEYVWDLLMASPAAPKKRGKSLIQSSSADDVKNKKTAPESKTKRDKIE